MKRKLLYIAAAALLFCSCSDQLFTEPEGGKVSDEQLTELINKDADAVLAPMMQSNLMWIHNGYYSESNMYKGIKCWSLALDLQGNDMVLTLTNNWYKDMYMLNNLRQQTSSNVAEYWYTLYKIVYRANQILDLMHLARYAALLEVGAHLMGKLETVLLPEIRDDDDVSDLQCGLSPYGRCERTLLRASVSFC